MGREVLTTGPEEHFSDQNDKTGFGCNHNKPQQCDRYKIPSDGAPIGSGTLARYLGGIFGPSGQMITDAIQRAGFGT